MDKTIYVMCAVTAMACCALLASSYLRTRFRLLLWSSLCFAGLAVNNAILFLDKTVFSDIDLSTWRLAIGLAAMLTLVAGLILDGDR